MDARPDRARGWVWGWRGQTTDARQILVTEVAAGSPVAGVLEPGDVLLGVDGKPFDDDARIQFARAVTRAETEQGRGVLVLLRWRAGHSQSVEVRLPVLGSYGARPLTIVRNRNRFWTSAAGPSPRRAGKTNGDTLWSRLRMT